MMSPSLDKENPTSSVGLQYSLAQLRKAVESVNEAPGSERAAAKRMREWTDAALGITSGEIVVGKRAPIRGFPEWVTPRVIKGGFAGRVPAAGGELLDHEIELADRLAIDRSRAAISAYYLSDDGLKQLEHMMATNSFNVEYPEEAALMVVAWLLRKGNAAAAIRLVDTLRPFFNKLRFYPVSAPGAHDDAACSVTQADRIIVNRFPASKAVAALSTATTSRRNRATHEAVSVWHPFYDRVARHWLSARGDAEIEPARLTQQWLQAASDLVSEFVTLRSQHTVCKKHLKSGRNTTVLLTALGEAIIRLGALGEGRRRQVSQRLAAMLRKRGDPNSSDFAERRAREVAAGNGGMRKVFVSNIVARRITALKIPDGFGIPSAIVREVLRPVSKQESSQQAPEGTRVPACVRRRVDSVLEAPLAELISRGVVPSAELVARLLSDAAGPVLASEFTEPSLVHIARAVHRAFAVRRSLLLLRLQCQVRVDDLPWFAELAPYASTAAACDTCKKWVRHAAVMTLRSFPHTVIPNVLVRELGKLQRRAYGGEHDAQVGGYVVLVEELAADIFEGSFSAKFAMSGRCAAEELQGSIYERYFAINFKEILDKVPVPSGKGSYPPFTRVCYMLAAQYDLLRPNRGSYVANNGIIVEMAQILTTHNIIQLVTELNIGKGDVGEWGDLASRCARAVCSMVDDARRLVGRQSESQSKSRCRHSVCLVAKRLCKRAAFAWRNMVLFLSLETNTKLQARVVEVLENWRNESTRHALQPHVMRLKAACDGHSNVPGAQASNEVEWPQPIVGWNCGVHALLKDLFKEDAIMEIEPYDDYWSM